MNEVLHIALNMILKILGFTTFIFIVKMLISLLFKKVNYKLMIAATLITSPIYFYIIFAHENLFGRISFYTIFLLVFTLSLFEYNIYLKRLFIMYSGLRIALFVFVSNVLAYGVSELLITYLFQT